MAGLRAGKTANALFAIPLDALGQDAGVRAFSVHPGGILTPLQRHPDLVRHLAAAGRDGRRLLRGLRRRRARVETAAVRAGVCDYAIDPEQAERLWIVSAQLTGVDAFTAAG